MNSLGGPGSGIGVNPAILKGMDGMTMGMTKNYRVKAPGKDLLGHFHISGEVNRSIF